MCVGSRDFEQKFLLYWQLSLILSYDVEVLVFYSVQLSFWIMIEEQALLLQKIISAQNGTCSFISIACLSSLALTSPFLILKPSLKNDF